MTRKNPTHQDVMMLNRMMMGPALQKSSDPLDYVEYNWSPDTGDSQRRYVMINGQTLIGSREAANYLAAIVEEVLGQKMLNKIYW